MSIHTIEIGCSLNSTIIDPDGQGFVDLIQGRDTSEQEGIVRISQEQWELLKKAVDFCFEDMGPSRSVSQ